MSLLNLEILKQSISPASAVISGLLESIATLNFWVSVSERESKNDEVFMKKLSWFMEIIG